MPGTRQLVFVSGAPGAGKTHLAVPLAAELGFALVAKDKIKERLHDVLGAPPSDLAWSRRLGAAAMELLWMLAADAPSVVVEANFRPRDPYQRDKLAALAEHPVEVYCQCDPKLAARRYDERARTCHPVHVVTSLPAAVRAEFDQPVGIGHLVTVNTALPVDVPAVAAAVRAHLPGTWPVRAVEILATLELGAARVVLRRAAAGDVPAIVGLIAADQLGATRDGVRTAADLAAYQAAFAAIDRDPAHLLVVGQAGADIVATMQLSFLPGLARRGALRAQIEAVRVDQAYRRHGLGTAIFTWAIGEARRRDCALVQLTTDKSRPAAHRFYERLGFTATHEGMKLRL